VKRLLLFGLLAMGGHAAAQTPAAPSVEREREQLVGRLERLREETAAAEARQEALGTTVVDLAGDEAKLRERLAEVSARVATMERQIADDELALETLTTEQARIRQELAGKREELATVLMALQRIGRSPPPALFSDADGPLDAVRGAILLNAALPELDAGAQALARSLSEAARLAADERERWANLRTELTDVSVERRRLEDLADELERRRALSLYERDQAAAELARLAEEAGTVEELLERLSRDGQADPSPAAVAFERRRGGLPDPVAGSVVSEYGDATETGGVTAGRTIAALPQSTVFAPMPARVVYSAPFRGYGTVLILDAGDGYHMVLAGMDESFVAPGDEVSAGSPLGRMGRESRRSAVASAGAGGSRLLDARPALYVELRKDGSAIDSHGWWRAASVSGGRTGG
jgi:septal ring factor EnvC (AmiA/AmiB activator)